MSSPTTSGQRKAVEALAEEFLDRKRRGMVTSGSRTSAWPRRSGPTT
jgi:hypothetical protein